MNAPEFPQNLTWLNSAPLTLEGLQGKIVLIDIWTYSCINCLRTLPHVKAWHERYKDKGLVIIGVHSPEFDFEKVQAHVEKAIADLGVTYPVVLDPDKAIWTLYANKYWPREILVNGNGVVIHDQVGEGDYDKTEAAIQQALTDIGATDLPAITSDDAETGGICYESTPESYLGFERGRFGHYIDEGKPYVYEDLGHHKKDVPSLSGEWIVHEGFTEHARTTDGYTDYVVMPYHSTAVNLVMKTADGAPREVKIELNGKPVPAEMAGKDIHVVDGQSMVTVSLPRLYELVNSKEFHEAKLFLFAKDGQVELFAFTFGGCATL